MSKNAHLTRSTSIPLSIILSQLYYIETTDESSFCFIRPPAAPPRLSPRQVADFLGHSTSEITELYYVKKDTARLAGITAGFEL